MGGILFLVFLWILNDIKWHLMTLKWPLFYIGIVFLKQLPLLAVSQINLRRSWWGRWGEYLKPSHVIGPKALAKMAEPGSPLKPWCFKSQLTLHGAWRLLQSLCFQAFSFITAWKVGLRKNRRTDKGFLWILSLSVVWLLLQCVMNLWKYSFFKIVKAVIVLPNFMEYVGHMPGATLHAFKNLNHQGREWGGEGEKEKILVSSITVN